MYNENEWVQLASILEQIDSMIEGETHSPTINKLLEFKDEVKRRMALGQKYLVAE